MSLVDLPTARSRPLAGKVVLVSGAHGGLGSAAAEASAAAGATVVLLGRRVPKLNRVYDACAQQGAEPLMYPLDLEGASPNDYQELVGRISHELGQLDGLLHCAAEFRGLTPLEHTDPAAFARALHVNLTAPWWLSQACLPLLRQAADPALVFTLDDLDRVGQAYWGGYGIAEHGLTAMVRMLQAEAGPGGLRVCALQPGPMRTALRARAYAQDGEGEACEATAYAQACVTLLSSAGNEFRRQVWKLRP